MELVVEEGYVLVLLLDNIGNVVQQGLLSVC